MSIIVRGIAMTAATPPGGHGGKQFHYKACAFHDTNVPIVINGGQGRTSTVIEAELRPQGDFYTFSAELPEDLEDAEWIIDAVLQGINGVGLGVMVDEVISRFMHRWDEVVSFTPLVLKLQPYPSQPGCYAWLEEDGKTTYQLPRCVEEARLEFFDFVGGPLPTDPYADGSPFEDEGARRIRDREDLMEGPLEGTKAELRFIPSRHGEVDLMVSHQGILMGLMRLDESGVAELAEAVDLYYAKFPNLDTVPAFLKDDEPDDPPDEEEDGWEGEEQ